MTEDEWLACLESGAFVGTGVDPRTTFAILPLICSSVRATAGSRAGATIPGAPTTGDGAARAALIKRGETHEGPRPNSRESLDFFVPGTPTTFPPALEACFQGGVPTSFS
jgi:hypothetical protein